MKDASTLTKIISGLFAVVIAIGGWWCNRVQNTLDELTKATIELQARAHYISGEIPAAPITTKLSEAK